MPDGKMYWMHHELASDSKYLGADIGYICILHTWGSEMNFHPHIHYGK